MKKLFIISVIMVITWLLTSCTTTTSAVANRVVKPKWIYKIETVSKDNDTTFQKIIK